MTAGDCELRRTQEFVREKFGRGSPLGCINVIGPLYVVWRDSETGGTLRIAAMMSWTICRPTEKENGGTKFEICDPGSSLRVRNVSAELERSSKRASQSTEQIYERY